MSRVKIVVLISSFALFSLFFVQYVSINTNLNYHRNIETINLSNKKIGQLYAVLNAVLDLETGTRGYVLTGIPKFLEPYNSAVKNVPVEMNKLKQYLAEDEFKDLSALVNTRASSASVIINKKTRGLVVTSEDFEISKKVMDAIREKIADFIHQESEFVDRHTTNESSDNVMYRLIGGSLLAFFIVAFCIVYVLLEFKKRQDAEKRLQISLATSEAISRDIDFGIIACDLSGNILFFNKWIFNKNPTIKKAEDFFASNSLVNIPIQKMFKGNIDNITGVELSINGETRVFSVNSSPFLVSDVIQGIILSITDTTDSTRRIESLVSSKQGAETASRAKSDFLAKMSHEIRTPLNAILGVGEILSLSKLNVEQEKCLEIFKRSAITLNNLVNDILDLSKIEAGKIDILNAPFSLNSLVNSCSSIMDFRASQKGLLFTINASNDFDHFIGDEGRIRQIILNLLSNAIKFTDKGEVKFSVRCEGSEPNRKDLYFSIADSGRGISKENIGKLFSDYQQEDSSISKEFGGTGLGLSLSRELARLMGGDIRVTSEFGKGSEFIFHIGLEQAEGEYVEETIDKNLNFSQMKILLVDDNQENRFIVKKYLSDFDIEIVEAVDGDDAISIFTKDKFDLVFMDINMPKKDGLSATKEIRALEKIEGRAETLIIALSANALSLEYSKAINAGCNDYLTKPISRLRLVSMLKKWAGKHIQIIEKESFEMNDEEIDIDIQALIPNYLDGRMKDLEVIKEAFSKKEMAIIAKLVHNIKGTALSYGQKNLDRVARELEAALQENRMEDVSEGIDKLESVLRVKNGH